MNKTLIKEGRTVFGGRLTEEQLKMIPSDHLTILSEHSNKREMSTIYAACIQNDNLMALPEAELLLRYCLLAPCIDAAKVLCRYYQHSEILQMPNIVDVAGIMMQTNSPDLVSYYNLLLQIDNEAVQQLTKSGLLFPVMQLMSTVAPDVLEYFFMTILKPSVISSTYVLRILTLFTMIQTEETAHSLFNHVDDLVTSKMTPHIIQLFHELSDPSQVQELIDHIDILISQKDISGFEIIGDGMQKSKKKVR